MLILSIETSCDETAAAVVKDGREILSNVVASSVEMHKKTGGIIPERAAREQVRSIIPVIQETLATAFPTGLMTYSPNNRIDCIAVTVGPGLLGSLLVGVETAKTLAYVWNKQSLFHRNKPLVPVNHLVGHIYANWIATEHLQGVPHSLHHLGGEVPKVPQFPAIALVASGGHTDLVLMKNHGRLKWLGGTRDDAAGEAFDKTARILGLGFPGGPAIAAAAAKLKVKSEKLKVILPRPLIEGDNFDFSFSGLKTAVLRETNKLKTMKQWNNETIEQLSFEVQEAITDVLVVKTLNAVKKYRVPTLLVGGGVAANSRLREKFELKIKSEKLKIDLRIPLPILCTDNAAMIGAAAYYNFKPVYWEKIAAKPGLIISEK